jgi:AhpD family alkylhydroperoxidase
MARVPMYDQTNKPASAALVTQICAERGSLLNLYKVLLNNEAVCQGWLQFFTAVRQKSKLHDRYRELATMRVAVINGAPYEYRAHAPLALQAGLNQAQVDELPFWRESSAYPANDQAVLAYTDMMTKHIQVPDAVFAPLKGFLDDQEIFELTMTIAGYNMVSRVLEALQVDHE